MYSWVHLGVSACNMRYKWKMVESLNPQDLDPKTLTTLQRSRAPLDNNGSETEKTDGRRVDLINVTFVRKKNRKPSTLHLRSARLYAVLGFVSVSTSCRVTLCTVTAGPAPPEKQTKSHYLIGHLSLKGWNATITTALLPGSCVRRVCEQRGPVTGSPQRLTSEQCFPQHCWSMFSFQRERGHRLQGVDPTNLANEKQDRIIYCASVGKRELKTREKVHLW